MQADGAGTDPGWVGLLFIDLRFIKRTIVLYSCRRYRSGLDKHRDGQEGTATNPEVESGTRDHCPS